MRAYPHNISKGNVVQDTNLTRKCLSKKKKRKTKNDIHLGAILSHVSNGNTYNIIAKNLYTSCQSEVEIISKGKS